MDKRLYQLYIYKHLGEYWRDAIFRSRLYLTKEVCMDGCLNTEIFDIAEIMRFYNIDDNVCDTDCHHKLSDVEESYNKGIPNVVQFVENVKKWLQGREGDFYGKPESMTDDYDLVSWEVDNFPVVTE